jgi:hypothetical protein
MQMPPVPFQIDPHRIGLAPRLRSIPADEAEFGSGTGSHVLEEVLDPSDGPGGPSHAARPRAPRTSTCHASAAWSGSRTIWIGRRRDYCVSRAGRFRRRIGTASGGRPCEAWQNPGRSSGGVFCRCGRASNLESRTFNFALSASSRAASYASTWSPTRRPVRIGPAYARLLSSPPGFLHSLPEIYRRP